MPGSGWTKTCLQLLATALILFVAYFVLTGVGERSEETSVVIPVADLDIGDVWETSSFPWTLHLMNTTQSDVRVVEVQTSCTCISAEPRDLVIAGGKTAEVELILDLTTVAQQESRPVHDLEVGVVAQLEGMPSIAWTLKGQVRRTLTLHPPAVTFGDSLIQGLSSKSMSVSVESMIPTKTVEIENPSSLVTVDLFDKEVGYELKVSPVEPLRPGEFDFAITLNPIDRRGSRLPPVLLPVSGRVAADLHSDPAAMVVLGVQSVGEVITEPLVLKTWSGRAFEVEDIHSSSSDLTVDVVSELPSKKHCRVVQQVASKGDVSSVIRFAIRLEGEVSVVELPVAVNYFGTTE